MNNKFFKNPITAELSDIESVTEQSEAEVQLTPRTSHYFETSSSQSPFFLPSEKLQSLKIRIDEVRPRSSKQTLAGAKRMDYRGDLFLL